MVFGTKTPEFLDKALSTVGNTTGPLALMIVGSGSRIIMVIT